MTRLEKYFKDTTALFLSEYERSGSLDHSTLKGNVRELFLSNFIKSVFPSKFVVGTGEIFDSRNQISKQADIIIYDELMPTFDYGGSQHYLSGGVLSHIEVKSKLDQAELNKALEVVESVKFLERDIDQDMHIGELPESIFSSVFSYSSIEPKTIVKHMSDFYSSKEESCGFVDAICVLNKCVILRNKNLEDSSVDPVICESGEDSLLQYFHALYSSMYKNWLGLPDLKKYCDTELTYKNISDL